MGIEFLLVLGLLLAISAMVPAMAHADDDRPDPEEEKRIKLENQEYDRRAIEQSRRLTREAQQRAAIEKQTAADRLRGLEDASEKTANFSQQLAEAGQQKAASFTVTPKLNTADLEKTTYEAVKGALERAATDGGSFLSDHWAKILGGIGTAALALKGRKMWKARRGAGGDISEHEHLIRMMGGADDAAAGAAGAAGGAGRLGRLWRGTGEGGGLGAGFKTGAFGGLATAGAGSLGLGTLLGMKGGGAVGDAVVNPALASLKNMFGGLHMQLNEATAQVRAFTNLTTDEDTFGALINNIYDTNMAWRKHGLEVEQIRDINVHLIEGFRRYSTESPRFQKDIVNTSSMMAILGVDAETSAKNMEIMGNVMHLTGKESSQFTKEIAATADTLNMSLPAVMKQFAGMEDKLAQFGPNAADAMRELMVVSRNTNIPMNDLLGTLDKFDTFDEAATAAGQLNAVLGGEFINDMELLNASLEGDTLGVMTIVQDALENSAVGWDDMGAAQRAALSEASGIGMANLARIARGDLTADMAVSTDAAMTEARAKEQAAQGRGIQRNIAQSLKGAETLLSSGKFLEGAPQKVGTALHDAIPAGGQLGDRGWRAMMELVTSLTTMWDAAKTELAGGFKLDKSAIDQFLAALKGTPITLQADGREIATYVGINNKIGGR